MVTKRQKEILEKVIGEYVRTAKPVGSEFLVENCGFNVCPATLRNEMQRLTEIGYLFQPHTSAGRVPTNKGYRFFVDEIREEKPRRKFVIKEKNEIEENANIFKMAESLARTLAMESSALGIVYLSEEDFLLKDGWGEVFQNPEFSEGDFAKEFVDTVYDFERDIKKILSVELDFSEPKVFIGKENSFLKSNDFSLVMSEINFFEEKGLMAILGPNRMAYDKNITIMNYLTNFLK